MGNISFPQDYHANWYKANKDLADAAISTALDLTSNLHPRAQATDEDDNDSLWQGREAKQLKSNNSVPALHLRLPG